MLLDGDDFPPPLVDGAMTEGDLEEEAAPQFLSSPGADPRSTARFPPADVSAGRGSGCHGLKDILGKNC